MEKSWKLIEDIFDILDDYDYPELMRTGHADMQVIDSAEKVLLKIQGMILKVYLEESKKNNPNVPIKYEGKCTGKSP